MSKPIILCVDDEAIVLESLTEQLQQRIGDAYDIETAESGEEALEFLGELLAEGIEIPIAIVDYLMPGMKGDELMKQIHIKSPQTLTILLTGHADADAVGRAVNVGNLRRYVSKPWEADDLVLIVNETIQRFVHVKLVEQHRRELEKMNVLLEQKVAQRTRELKDKNRQLQDEIAERERVEAAIRESESKLSGILAAMDDLVFVLDNEGCFTFYHTPSGGSLYRPPDEFIGKRLTDVMPAHLNKLFDPAFERNEQGEVAEYEYWLQAEEGFGWYLVKLSPMFAGDEFVGAVAVVRDITGRKQAEEQLQHYTTQLEAVNAELTQYAHVVSHDLRAPLRGIRNYADFLREDLTGTLKEEQQMYLDGLGKATREAEQLVSDLLGLARLGRQEAPVETADSGALLRDLVAALRLGDEVEVVMMEEWPTLKMSPVYFRQIFQNLITNAVKFNPSPRKRVELGWHLLAQPPETSQGRSYEFYVRDNGLGIEPRFQRQIFRLFERLHTKEEYEGTGVGLAIVEKACGIMGGAVRVESKSGEGSTFFVTLPKNVKREA